MVSGIPPPDLVALTVTSADIVTHFVDADSLLGGGVGVPEAAGRRVAGAPPALLSENGGVEAYDLDVDQLLGASYDASEPVRLPNWVETDDVPELSDGSSSGGYASDGGGGNTDGEEDEGGDGAAMDDEASSIDAGDDAQRNPGFQRPGDGRTRGSGLNVRESMQDIFVILLCRQMEAALALRTARDSASEQLLDTCIASVRALRLRYKRITDSVLATKAWTLRRSGSVGAVFKFKNKGARDNQARDSNLAVEVFLSDDDSPLVCCSRGEENCLEDGCAQRDVILRALDELTAATGMDVPGVLALLSEDLRVSALNQGIAVLYGPNICVVRREGGSWPFAVVRRKPRDGVWMCHACAQGPGTCTHAYAAKEADGNEQSEASDDDDLINNLGRGRQPRRSNTVYSTSPRPLVPSARSLAGHADVVRASVTGDTIILPAPSTCKSCGFERSGRYAVFSRFGVVEFGQGAVATRVQSWWCARCREFCVTDGLEQGLVMCSQFTAYTEFFLFECTINLCRNASSLTATYDLRSAFHELMREHAYPLTLTKLRSLPLFRFAALLYIYLVLDELPLAVSTCAVCTRADGSLQFICFDGLQVGFKVRYQTPFTTISVKLCPINRASIQALLVSDTAVGRALGSVLSSATSRHETAAGPIKTVTAMRGHMIALAVLAGDVEVAGQATNLAGETPHAENASRSRGWDPIVDGGVHESLLLFFRELFRGGRAARKLARTILNAPDTLLAKVPAVLMDRVKAVDGAGDADAGTDTESSADGSSSDGGRGGGSDDQPVRPARRRHLAAYSRVVADPILADAGGVAGEERRGDALLRPLPNIVATAGSAERLVDFARAVVIDPVVVWAPAGDWTAVGVVVEALRAEPFSRAGLQAAVRHVAVKELRLLHGAVVTLYPSLCTQPRVRVVLLNVLLAMCVTDRRYQDFVDKHAAAEIPRDERGNLVMATREQMAAAPAGAMFHPKEFEAAYPECGSTWEKFSAAYGERAMTMLDYLVSGQWAPSFPPVRALPDFLAVQSSTEDHPECSHIMGTANRFTGGTFAASCTCTHPKTIGVVVLQGSESQRMPIEFVVQRMPRFPDRIFYDFACACLKMALCRLPYIALFLAMLVDRFHWLKNHIWCSKAMNPDSYKSMDAQNTSASEERNAASRRLQNFLRLVKQRNFILFTVYQQAVGNVIAMHRDAKDKRGSTVTDDWPLWYRKNFVDNAATSMDADATSEEDADGNDAAGEADADGGATMGEEVADGGATMGEEVADGAATMGEDVVDGAATMREDVADGADATREEVTDGAVATGEEELENEADAADATGDAVGSASDAGNLDA
ncbi:hypothetical protein BU14_0350s0001 [Porphyra umbilicalis]|uniref:HMG domain-containing protein n=1 Tax=Porphyra umbilicalis TaxID=2786 RepID=A0A1X6NXS9_PORUM|nr:hypothetical protein BU14_0350s0001 [Porphyra umbilicalis]|eukprot:OSX73408.1 hypothetical protein BU14_0350s0001 [Porphyra umbilicalis]